jgi:hypothetical protein
MDRITKEKANFPALSAFLNLDNPVNPVYFPVLLVTLSL